MKFNMPVRCLIQLSIVSFFMLYAQNGAGQNGGIYEKTISLLIAAVM